MARLLEQVKLDLIKEYSGGISAYKLSDKYGISPTAIYGILKRSNVERRSYSDAGRQYSLNEHYFDVIDTESKAYYLGLLIADGYNNENRGAITLILVSQDEAILNQFSKDIGSDKPILHVNNKNGAMTARMELCSRILSSSLAKIGCVQTKTFKIKFPYTHLSDELVRHFIRGYFDGDGCFSYSEATRNNHFGNSLISVVSIVGTLDFCNSVKDILSNNLDITSAITKRKKESLNNIVTLRITGTNQVIKFMDWLYEGANVFLDRKNKKYHEFLSKLGDRKGIVSKLRSENAKIQITKYNDPSALIKLSDIVKTTNERWNARYFMTNGKVESLKGSLFTRDQADILRKLLDQYGEESAIPNEDIELYFTQARSWGFPYYEIDMKKFEKGIYSLKKANILKTNGVYNWDGKGSEYASFFHPHMFKCKRKDKISALEFYESDEDLKRGIWKLLALYGEVTKSNLREICRNEKVSSRINQFPPKVAMTVIKDLFPNGGIKYLDPTHGFSGRLLGAYCSGLVKKYVGIDLSKDTYNGALKTIEWMQGKSNMVAELINEDCLTIMPILDNDFDLVFTSPPFLDVERYFGVNFETDYNRWINNFITPFIDNAYSCLKVGGKMAVYLEKINKYKFLEDFSTIAITKGFKRCDDILFKMSYGENNRDSKTSRGIPILVFQK